MGPNWSEVGKAATSPYTVVSLVFTLALLVGLQFVHSAVLTAVLELLVALTASVTGGSYFAATTEMQKRKELFTHGRAAVRTLGLLLTEVDDLRAYVLTMREEVDEADEVMRLRVEGVLQAANRLDRLVRAGIQAWEDVVPESRDVLEAQWLKEEMAELEDTRDRLLVELTALSSQREAERSQTEGRLESAEKGLEMLRAQLRQVYRSSVVVPGHTVTALSGEVIGTSRAKITSALGGPMTGTIEKDTATITESIMNTSGWRQGKIRGDDGTMYSFGALDLAISDSEAALPPGTRVAFTASPSGLGYDPTASQVRPL